MSTPWPVDLSRPAPVVGPELLGCVLRVDEVAIRLTEVEAYDGAVDPASHSFNGPTPRNRAMFGPAGHLYVYFSYGIHSCCNIVCDQPGVGSGCLLRAGEVVAGIDVARARRGDVPDVRLAKGPGNLARCLGLTTADSGREIDGVAVELLPPAGPVGAVVAGPRVGVSRGVDTPWRFWLAGERTVSPYSRSPRAPRPQAPTHTLPRTGKSRS